MKIQRFVSKGLIIILLTTIIVSTTQAEIPFTQAQGIYEATEDKYKDISPFWAMVAVHGKLIDRIRLHGFYKKDKKGNDDVIDKEDKIAALLLKLFSSPDGTHVVPNGYETIFKNLSQKDNFIQIDNIIQELLKEEKQQQKEKELERVRINREKKALEIKRTRILDIAGLLTTKRSEKNDFTNILINAYEQQKIYANPNNPFQQRYPKNIVIISLLSFLVKVAKDKTELIAGVPSLFKKEIEKEEKEKEIADITYNKLGYEKVKGTSNKEFTSSMTSLIESSKHDPKLTELAFFMAKGFEAYENVVAEPIDFIQQQVSIKGATMPFSDCGETALRNFFMLLLSAGNGGTVSVESLDSLDKQILESNTDLGNTEELNKHTPYKKFKYFINKYADITQGTSKTIHDEWAEIVSNLNEGSSAQGMNRIQYGNKLVETGEEVYELKCNFREGGPRGIINMLNLIARIIPDEVLNESWPDEKEEQYNQVIKKLEQICKLFSRDDIALTWKNERTADKTIDSEFPIIIFSINGEDAFQWLFQQRSEGLGHFDIKRMGTTKEDWRTNFAYCEDFRYFNNPEHYNEWMASLFPGSLDIHLKEEEKHPINFFPATMIYNNSLKTLEGAKNTIQLVFNHKKQAFYPLINRWVQQFIQPTNLDPFIDMVDYLGSLQDIVEVKVEKKIEKKKKKGEQEEKSIPSTIITIIEDAIKIAKEQGMLKTNIVILALRNNKFHAARILIEVGANLDVKDNNENTPLHLAVLHSNEHILNMLIEHHAKVNATNNDGNTPLHLASSQGDVGIVKTLLFVAKADPTIRNTGNNTPLHLAVSHENASVLRLLIQAADKKIDLNAQNQDGNTLLHLAAFQDNPDVVYILLEENVDCNIPNNDDNTPLHLAILSNRIPMFESIVKSGCKVNLEAINKNGDSPLHIAATKEYPEFAKILLEKGVNYNILSLSGDAPVHLAVRFDAIGVLNLLIQDKDQLGNPNADGQTPLYLAAVKRKEVIVRILIENGAQAKNIDGKELLLDIAEEIGKVKQKEIRRYAPGGTDDLEKDYIKIIKQLVSAGTTIDKKAKIDIKDESSEDEWSDEEGNEQKKEEDEQNIVSYLRKEGYKLLAGYLSDLK